MLCYEIRLAATEQKVKQPELDSPLATAEEMEGMYAHFETVLTDIAFLKQDNPGQLMRRLRRLFNRCQLEKLEINILRGILTAVQKLRSSAD